MKRSPSLRQMMEQPGPLVAPGVYDGLTARMAESLGFNAAYVTGFGISTTLLGTPDIGLTTMTELVGVIGRIASVTRFPLIADGEAGFGNIANLTRAVQEYERVGVSAIQIEDQLNPKLYKPSSGMKLISAEEQADRIKAAIAA